MACPIAWPTRLCKWCTLVTLNRNEGTIIYWAVFVTTLKALDPVLMESVTVVQQSEVILLDPSNFWISVITISRLAIPSFTQSNGTRLFGLSRVLLVRLIPEPGHAHLWTPCCCKKRLFQHRRTILVLCRLVPLKLFILSFVLLRTMNCPYCG